MKKTYNVQVRDEQGNIIAYHNNLETREEALKEFDRFEEMYSMQAGAKGVKIPVYRMISIHQIVK